MNDYLQNDDAAQSLSFARCRPGPVADPHVEARMRLLADALGGDIDGAEQKEVVWDGVDDLAAAFLAIKDSLIETPTFPTRDVPDSDSRPVAEEGS